MLGFPVSTLGTGGWVKETLGTVFEAHTGLVAIFCFVAIGGPESPSNGNDEQGGSEICELGIRGRSIEDVGGAEVVPRVSAEVGSSRCECGDVCLLLELDGAFAMLPVGTGELDPLPGGRVEHVGMVEGGGGALQVEEGVTENSAEGCEVGPRISGGSEDDGGKGD